MRVITLGVDPGTALLGYGLVRGDDDARLIDLRRRLDHEPSSRCRSDSVRLYRCRSGS